MGTSLGISQVTTSAGQIPSADNDRAGVKGRKAKLEKREMSVGEGGDCCKNSATSLHHSGPFFGSLGVHFKS